MTFFISVSVSLFRRSKKVRYTYDRTYIALLHTSEYEGEERE